MDIKQIWLKILSYFSTRYKLTVSYNAVYGDADDTTYIVRKFLKKQPKYLKFLNEDKEVVEIRGADGLNYRIEEI